MKNKRNTGSIRLVADKIIDKRKVLGNPYLDLLTAGRMSRDSFIQSQEQFYFAVAEYSKPIAVLTSRVNDLKMRFELLRNMLDEHGEFNESACHETTFRAFLARLGGQDPRTIIMNPAVASFNAVLMATSLTADFEEGIACLAIIEYAFAFISATIAAGAIRNGWIAPEEMLHYSIHSSLDLEHADGLFSLIVPKSESKQISAAALRGLELGAFIFERLYSDLYNEYCRNEVREIKSEPVMELMQARSA